MGELPNDFIVDLIYMNENTNNFVHNVFGKNSTIFSPSFFVLNEIA